MKLSKIWILPILALALSPRLKAEVTQEDPALTPAGAAFENTILNQKIIFFKQLQHLTRERKEEMIKSYGGRPLLHLGRLNAVAAYFPNGFNSYLSRDTQVARVADDGVAYAAFFPGCSEKPKPEATPRIPTPVKVPSPTPTPSATPTPTPTPTPVPTPTPARFPQFVPWQTSRVKAPQVWVKSLDRGRGEQTKVCVIDSGIDQGHPELSGNIINAGGASFAAGTAADDIQDTLGHGTHVNGIIAAAHNATGLAGIAPAAELYQARVFGASGSASWSTVVAALEWCADNGMQVVNMSLGGGYNEALDLAIQDAHQAGLVLVAAAGNSYGGPVGYPGAFPNVIAVSASDYNDAFASFSSQGPEVDLIAPGTGDPSLPSAADPGNPYRDPGFGILSTVPGGYGEKRGTSMASPVVAGAASLILGLDPTLTNEEVQTILENTAQPLETLTPDQKGHGQVDAESAAQALGY